MAEYELELPDELRYSDKDEWARIEGAKVTVGVTDYAQHNLGDVSYVELPSVGTELTRGEPFGVIESVKAVSDLYAPVSGEVVEVNGDLQEQPETVNEDCYGDGWMLTIAVEGSAEYDELMDAKSYRKHCDERED